MNAVLPSFRPEGREAFSMERAVSLDEALLSEYGSASSVPAPVGRMMADFARDFRPEVDINLGVGYVNENTIPRELILEAVREVVSRPEKHRHALNYGGPAGSPNLIDSIRRFHIESGIGGLTGDVLGRNEIVIGPSGATSLLEGIGQVMEPGIVVTSDPVYYIYSNFLERTGFEVVAVPEDEEGIDTDRVEARLAELGERKRDVRFFYVVTISNPTCTILSNARRRRLVGIAAGLSRELGRKVLVVLDCAYECLVHDQEAERPESALPYDDLGLVYELGTLSKILAPALRIGYMIGRDSAFFRAMVQRTSDVGFSAPLVMQEAASVLLDRHAAAQIARVNAGYREKARQVGDAIDRELGRFVAERRGGKAGFYYYVALDGIETHERSPFFRFLARSTGDAEVDGAPGSKRPRVVYLPGEFCCHPGGELVGAGSRELRLSYGYEETGRILKAVALMAEAARYARGRP
jgi:DNA-binding transcriptional MocR family regulator